MTKKKGQAFDDLTNWILLTVHQHFNGVREFSRPAALELCLNLLPDRFKPDYATLLHQWFTRRFGTALAKNGFGFPGGSTGATIVNQLLLPLDEFFELMVEELRGAKFDVDSVHAKAVVWRDANNATLDVDAFMARAKRAAGL